MILTFVNRGISDITDGRGFYDVPYNKFLDRFILRNAPSTVGTPDGLNVATTVLASATISSFTGLENIRQK